MSPAGGGPPARGQGGGESQDDRPPAYDALNCKQGGRAFCRVGTVFTPVGQIVTAGVNWDLARDARLRALASLLLPGSMPTKEEVAGIEPTR